MVPEGSPPINIHCPTTSIISAFDAKYALTGKNITHILQPVKSNALSIIINSIIYPAIGKYLNLALICEVPADAKYFPWQIIQEFIVTQKGCPQSASAEVLVEHEMNPSSSIQEMKDLAKWNAPLNVLITYFVGSVTDQAVWANKTFAEILGIFENSAYNFLLILPGKDPATDPLVSKGQGSRNTPCADWWSFFEWSAANGKFQRVP